MADIPSNGDKEASIEELGGLIAKSLLAGTPSENIIETLAESGFTKKDSKAIISAVKKGLLSRVMRSFYWGLLLIIIGAVISAVTYAAASSSPEGGYYFIWWGPAAYGVYKCCRALLTRHKINKL